MCGRLNVIHDPLHRLVQIITGMQVELTTQYNVAPTEAVPVLVPGEGGWQIRDMRWWLVPWWTDEPTNKYSMFNARSETLTRSRAFREPFRYRRCIIPASGYYEWAREANVRIPRYILPAEDSGFAFAGLWDRWKRDDQVIESCTIVTAAAPASMAHIHKRIPVHLSPAQVSAWVNQDTDPETLQELLAPTLRIPVAIVPVSNYVNNSRNKEAACIEPIEATEIVSLTSGPTTPPGTGSLF